MMKSFLTTFFTRTKPTPASGLRDTCKTGTVDEVSSQLDVEPGIHQSADLLVAAMEGNNIPVLEYLITKSKDDQPSPPWQTDYKVIMQATERLEHFKLFWEADPSVSTAYLGHTGNVPGFAVMGQNIPLLAFLLKTGLNPDDAQLMHRPAINWAVHSGYSEIVGLLLDHGAHVKESNALAIALEADKLDILKLLVEKGGMDVNVVQEDASDDDHGDNDGDDAANTGPVLHLAIAKGQTEMVRALLQDLKADATVKDGKGRTALQRAQEQGNQAILSLLARKT